MTKDRILLSVFTATFLTVASLSVIDPSARNILYEFSKLFLAGYVGYLLK
ncbi:MAG: hypothetical protein KME32_34675 [Mojavia pulchra JT2-VF2]|jgi:hypothetical protein|uniref:Uncharacterized protein n=1 Tax=Mojavia pulchra JT2-VF2 TaxID=287848 RepID=A0A951Q8L0_9NOST|nr:hypothetical protein [Mojavia pulchra JT2-VF2]